MLPPVPNCCSVLQISATAPLDTRLPPRCCFVRLVLRTLPRQGGVRQPRDERDQRRLRTRRETCAGYALRRGNGGTTGWTRAPPRRHVGSRDEGRWTGDYKGYMNGTTNRRVPKSFPHTRHAEPRPCKLYVQRYPALSCPALQLHLSTSAPPVWSGLERNGSHVRTHDATAGDVTHAHARGAVRYSAARTCLLTRCLLLCNVCKAAYLSTSVLRIDRHRHARASHVTMYVSSKVHRYISALIPHTASHAPPPKTPARTDPVPVQTCMHACLVSRRLRLRLRLQRYVRSASVISARVASLDFCCRCHCWGVCHLAGTYCMVLPIIGLDLVDRCRELLCCAVLSVSNCVAL